MAGEKAGNWLKEHYDQLLVSVSLIALVASVLFLLIHVKQERNILDTGKWKIPVRQAPVEAIDLSAFNEAVAQIGTPFQAQYDGPSTFVSERRVSCINAACAKPIAFDATTCPFCGWSQPSAPEVDDAQDQDGDGMPDNYEEAHGLDPNDPNDAGADLDGDTYSNLEEYQSRTSPSDPASYPPPEIRLVKTASRPFEMIFETVSMMDPENPTFQLNMLSREKSYFAELGEVIEGYLVERYDPNAPGGATLYLRRGDRTVGLVRGQVRRHDQWFALLVSLQERRRIKVGVGDDFKILEDAYKVVDINRREVIIQTLKSEEKFTVPKLTAAELEELRGNRPRPGAPGRPLPSADRLLER